MFDMRRFVSAPAYVFETVISSECADAWRKPLIFEIHSTRWRVFLVDVFQSTDEKPRVVRLLVVRIVLSRMARPDCCVFSHRVKLHTVLCRPPLDRFAVSLDGCHPRSPSTYLQPIRYE